MDAARRSVEDAAAHLGVDPRRGLSAEEAARRLDEHGRNELAEGERRPGWRIFLDQFRNVLIGVLLVAAVIAGVIGELKDAIVIAVVLLINATIGYVQEHRAEESMAALRGMLAPSTRVRRDGSAREVAAAEVVPGDVVLLEAGDRVPADARLVVARNLEVDESALTGESQPVTKDTDPLEGDDVPLGDRTNLLFLNTAVTRGRAEAVVTDTGMATEIGRVADLIAGAEPPQTPLQRQLDVLGKRLALVAAVAVVGYFLLGLARGEDPSELAITAIALTAAAVPEGLPAVLAVTLALGMRHLAREGAIVKRMASVETLGSTTVICTDKTGTLTRNVMTARAVAAQGRRYTVADADGEHGVADRETGEPAGDLRALLRPLALCSDAELRGDDVVGDPTETALLVLAAEGGVEPAAERDRWPRIAEIPFESSRKFMATFHEVPAGEDGAGDVYVAVKGAPDVVLERCGSVARPDGPIPLDGDAEERVQTANREFGEDGLRVLAAATRRLPRDGFDPGGDLEAHLDDLVLEGLVGVADPPRSEAIDAVAACHRAGMQVKMITGDHPATAGAIAREIGIRGKVITGRDLDRLDEDELVAELADVGVMARVSPEHKLKVVAALQRRGDVVAMTGDGVNDAPALKSADIGVAMGITGTDVSREAAAMVLTDDNFATIERAVERGRTIYDNVVKFLRFQLSTNFGAILTVVGAPLVGLPAPFTAVQVLWVNLIMDGPPALALGVDPPRSGIMEESPRRPDASILPGRRVAHLLLIGATMAAGTLGLLSYATGWLEGAEATTLAFTTFVFFQIVNALNVRDERRSTFSRETFRNRRLWIALGAVAVLQVLAVEVPLLQGIFDTTGLPLAAWGVAIAVALSVLVVEEVRKAVVRARG